MKKLEDLFVIFALSKRMECVGPVALALYVLAKCVFAVLFHLFNRNAYTAE